MPRGRTGSRAGTPAGKCVICVNLPLKDLVNKRFAEGASRMSVGREVREAGYRCSDASVRVHYEHTNTPQMQVSLSKQEGLKPKDLAVVVRDRTLEAVENGELQPTDSNWRNVTPGLQAQALLDRREQKVDDRRTALLLAQILYGGGPGGAIVPPPDRLLISDGEEIEGVFTEVD